MPTVTTTKEAIINGSPTVLIYHELYHGNNILIQINSKQLIDPWKSVQPELILNTVKNKIESITKYKFNIDKMVYDDNEVYQNYKIGTGDFLFIVETTESITEDMVETIQSEILKLKLTYEEVFPTCYVETYGSKYYSEGMVKTSLPTLSVFLLHFYGDRTLLFRGKDYSVIKARALAKLKNATLANDVTLPEEVKLFTASKNYDFRGNIVLGDDFAIELYDNSYARSTDFDELLNNLYDFLNSLNVSNFYKVWVQTTSLKYAK
jgi:hypothetical protein